MCQLSALMTVPGARGVLACDWGVCVLWPIADAKVKRKVRLQTTVVFFLASRGWGEIAGEGAVT